MESISINVKNYTHYFSPNGEYKYFDDISPILRKKTTLFFSKVLTKIDNDFGNKKYLDVLNDCFFFGTSFDSSDFDMSSKFMIDISFKYVEDLNEKYVTTNISTLKSKQENIVTILNILTDILYTNDKIHREIDSVWMLFLHNLNPFILELIDIEKREISSWKSRLEIEPANEIEIKKNDNPFPNYTNSDWGWIDFHITSFIKCYFNVLEEILTVNEQVVCNIICSGDKEKNYSYLKNVSKNLRKYFSSVSIQEVRELKPLENFIKDKYYKIIEKNQMYEQYNRENKTITLKHIPDLLNLDKELESQKGKVEWFEKLVLTTPYSENESKIHKNLNFDFIDYFKGLTRKERESDFIHIMDILIEYKLECRTIILDKNCKYGVLWSVNDRDKGKRITALIQTLIETGWIQTVNEKPIEILEKFKKCFGLISLKGITVRNFEAQKLDALMLFWGKKLDFIPKRE